MEKSSEKKHLQFEDLIFDHVYQYTEQYGNESRTYTVTTRWINCVSGMFTSGETTLLLSDYSATKTHFFQVLTGRIDSDHKTYGLVTYNGKERTWDSWKNTIKLVDFDEIKLNMDIKDYFRNEIRYKYPESSEDGIEDKLNDLFETAEKTTGMKIKDAELTLEELQILIVVLHTLLEPEILLLNNVETKELSDSNFTKILNNFAKDKNAIVIVAESKPYFNLTNDEHLDNFDNLLQFKDKYILFHESIKIYRATSESLYQMPNYSLQSKIVKILRSTNKTTHAANNLDVSTSKIDAKGITFFLTKRLPRFFSKSNLICLISLIVIFKLCMIFGGGLIYNYTLENIGQTIRKYGVYEGDHSFYMGCIYYLNSLWKFTIVISVITLLCFEYFAYLNFSEDFLYGIRNPADFIIACFLSCNLPGYIFQIIALMIFEMQHRYFSTSGIVYTILISLIYFAIINCSLLFFIPFYKDKQYIPVIINFMPMLFRAFCRDPSNDITKQLLGFIIFILNPIYILDGIIEVLCFKRFINIDKSDKYFDQYIALRIDDIKKLYTYYGLNDKDFTAEKLLGYENLNPDDLFLVHNLYNNLYFNLIFLLISILSVCLVTITFGKKNLLQNIRLKLIKN